MNDFHAGMAEILELDPASVGPDTLLESDASAWDSLAIVSTIALVDDVFGVMLSGQALMACKTVADIGALVDAARPG
jgi:acyl carrier protein